MPMNESGEPAYPQFPGLSELPSICLRDKASLPVNAAVYFAVAENGEVLYIGATTNLRSRWVRHHRFAQLRRMPGVRITWMSAARQRGGAFVPTVPGRQDQAAMGTKNWTIEVLAAKSGVSTQTISLIRQGIANVRIGTLKKVADTLVIPMADLFEGIVPTNATKQTESRVRDQLW